MGDDGGDCTENCMDYKKFIAYLKECGLETVDKRNDCDNSWHKAPPGTWCGNWIWHYAFQRRGADGSLPTLHVSEEDGGDLFERTVEDPGWEEDTAPAAKAAVAQFTPLDV